MFKIVNASGCVIASVNEEQLDKIRKDGLLKPSDKIIEE